MIDLSFQDLRDKVCVITGGGGVIGAAIGKGLASLGVKVVIMDLFQDRADAVAEDVKSSTGGTVLGVVGNVLDRGSLETAHQKIIQELGQIDILINGAGGNAPTATTDVEMMTKNDLKGTKKTFFGLDIQGFQKVFDLNFMGTLLPTMVFSEGMVERENGVILNISSMNSFRPLTKIPAYSAAKASINNFTEWLAVHLARAGVRVNAVAPGFFLTNQNRFLLINEGNGQLTTRGEKIINGTPMGRFGETEDLLGTVCYLISDVSAFVTGIVIPVDGGFNAYSGV